MSSEVLVLVVLVVDLGWRRERLEAERQVVDGTSELGLGRRLES